MLTGRKLELRFSCEISLRLDILNLHLCCFVISWIFSFRVTCTRSVDNEIVLWKPKTKEQSPGEGTVDILQKYPAPECDIWFLKFSCDFHYNSAAIGNREGKIFIWELQSSPPVLIASTILSCCEDGTIWRWDAVQTN
ncbi:Polycomb group protein FIE2 [Hibiscus syriacus]|uniref:Polycomb group protein FIE2 n=1 Tax=Hibiscus syriacus TaxID=106335 RepID=A0A6A2ZPZ5_HIBSY|nr:Polycomb group protein FIE2 [Hibiscus syriacus]